MSLFNYRINLNKIDYFKKKKNIVLLIRRSPGELDWILPLIYNLKKKYNIFTIFRFKYTLDLIKKDKYLHNIWQNTSFAYTVEPKFHSFFFKFLNHLFKKTIFNTYFNEIFFNSYYNFSHLKKLILKNKNLEFKVSGVFAEFSSHSPWIKKIQNLNKHVKIIHFPHTTNIFGNKRNKVKNKNKSKNLYLLISNNIDYDFWKIKFPKFNIIESGYLKYDRIWLNKFLPKKNNIKNKIAVISYRGFHKGINFKNYKDQVISLMNTLINFKNFKVIFKIHPMTSTKELEEILHNYPKDKWEISTENQLFLIYKSDLFISFYSSASIIDALALNKIPLELWNILDKKFISNFKPMKLSVYLKNPEYMEKMIKKMLFGKDQKKYELYFKKKVQNNFFIKNSVNITTKKILNILD